MKKMRMIVNIAMTVVLLCQLCTKRKFISVDNTFAYFFRDRNVRDNK